MTLSCELLFDNTLLGKIIRKTNIIFYIHILITAYQMCCFIIMTIALSNFGFFTSFTLVQSFWWYKVKPHA